MDWIDIIVREKDDSFVISIKDNGINFNPENINSSADDIDYSQILGFNITLLTVKNN
ncbi:MAG: ATP-binding protein [Methanobrevibacter millerae]|uniref:ATP-binding protein n=2 Tax=Methanobrevibacter millerae TaxID=230361 RepID=A0A8T3VCX2_9EURY|nr:ATP-binding protein [Methanobrevibacter millerae]